MQIFRQKITNLFGFYKTTVEEYPQMSAWPASWLLDPEPSPRPKRAHFSLGADHKPPSLPLPDEQGDLSPVLRHYNAAKPHIFFLPSPLVGEGPGVRQTSPQN